MRVKRNVVLATAAVAAAGLASLAGLGAIGTGLPMALVIFGSAVAGLATLTALTPRTPQ